MIDWMPGEVTERGFTVTSPSYHGTAIQVSPERIEWQVSERGTGRLVREGFAATRPDTIHQMSQAVEDDDQG